MVYYRDLRFFLAFLFAISIWLYANFYTSDLIRVFRVPVFIQHINDNYVVVEKTASEVTLSLKGPQIFFKTFEEEFKQINLRLSQGSGSHRLLLNEKILNLPKGLKLLSIEPKFIDVIIDEIDERQVNVKIDLVDSPVQYIILKNISHPGRVILSGPRSVLYNISEIRTAKIDLSNLEFNPYLRSKTIKVPLVVPEKTKVKGSSIIPISFNYDILTETVEFRNLKVEPPAGFRCVPSSVNVKVISLKGVQIGEPKLVANMSSAEQKAVIQVQGGFGIVKAIVDPPTVELIPDAPMR